MSNASVDPVAAGSGNTSPSASRRAALVGAVIAVAIAAVVLVAHAANGSAARSTATSSSPSMSTGSMQMSSPSDAPVGASTGTHSVMTIQGANLPSMSMSGGAMPMEIVPLGSALWDGMRIQARTSAPATFELFNGTSQRLVRPSATDSFHLMVTLADESTNFAIPYSSVWATIRKNGKIVFDERLWPMISRYMGPHYGANVALPSAGLYHVALLVSPPVAARHLEYKGLWLKPHKVNLTFRWVPKT